MSKKVFAEKSAPHGVSREISGLLTSLGENSKIYKFRTIRSKSNIVGAIADFCVASDVTTGQ